MTAHERFSRNGHVMEIQEFTGQGGGVEDVFLWCHTCDPAGDGIPNGRIDVEQTPIREALLELRKLAFRHSNTP